MFAQSLVVALLVLGCSTYALWALMPSAARRALAAALLRVRLPNAVAARLRQVAEAKSGCGCDGCDRSPVNQQQRSGSPAGAAAKPPAGTHVITFHPRAPR